MVGALRLYPKGVEAAIPQRARALTEAVYGLLLAGGLSRRMGGGDKALRAIGGEAILARVILRLKPQCTDLLLNANGDPQRFESYGLSIVADDLPGHAGPLAGILAGLDWLAIRLPEVRWAVSVAADTPFIPLDLVARLCAERARAGTRLACARSQGRVHPVIGLWPVSSRHDLRSFLVEDGLRKVDLFASRYGRVEVDWPVEPFDVFFNANVPEDLDEAESIARRLDETKI